METTLAVIRFVGGLDNRSMETELPEGTLRICENLDVTRKGSLLSRLGLRSVSAGNYHSSYTPGHGRFVLLVKNGTLGILSGDESFSSLVSLIQNAPVNYAELNGDVFWMTPYQRGKVNSNGEASYWGLNVPFIASISASATGGLYAGDYQVTLTSVYQGMESGAPATTAVTVPDGGGISITVPVGGSFNIYVSNANGTSTELRYAATATSGSTVTIGTGPRGRLLDSLLATPPRPGSALCAYKGRLWIAEGNTLWFTSERSPHWLFPNTGFFRESTSITGLGTVDDGIYIGTSSSIVFLQGNEPASMTRRVVSVDAGVVVGTICNQLPFDIAGNEQRRQCMWLDTNGYPCIGKPSGIIVRPTLNKYSAGPLLNGLGAYRVREGIRQLLFVSASNTTNFNTGPNDVPIAEQFNH